MATKMNSVKLASLIVGGLVTLTGVGLASGGTYDHTVVSSQLQEQRITFGPAEGLPDNMKQYAGTSVVTGNDAAIYADLIKEHVNKATGGRTYAEVSEAARKMDPSDPNFQKAQELRRTALDGQLLRGTLLSAWGWWLVGTIAQIIGALLSIIGLGIIAGGMFMKSRVRTPAPVDAQALGNGPAEVEDVPLARRAAVSERPTHLQEVEGVEESGGSHSASHPTV